MNRYGLLAQEHWLRYAPMAYEELEDPEKFFTELGESAALQIDQVTLALEAQIPKGLDYLEQVQQLTMCQRQAEEIVLTELVYSREAEPSMDWQERLEEALGYLPDEDSLDDSLWRVHQDIEWENEMFGLSADSLPDEATQERLDLLHELLALVRIPREGLSGQALVERVLAAEAMVQRRTVEGW